MASIKVKKKNKKKKRERIIRDVSKLPDWAILRIPEICDCLGCGKSTLYQRISNGEFPALIRIGKRISGQTVETTRKACEDLTS